MENDFDIRENITLLYNVFSYLWEHSFKIYEFFQ